MNWINTWQREPGRHRNLLKVDEDPAHRPCDQE